LINSAGASAQRCDDAVFSGEERCVDPDLDEAPEARPTKPGRPPGPGSVAKALLTGAGIEIVGTLVVGVVAALAYGMVLASQGLSREEVNQALAHMEPLSVVGLLSGAAGSFVSVFAGYACAARARRRSYRTVGAMSALSVALGWAAGLDAYSAATAVILSLLTVAAVMFGGWLYIRDLPAH
jgi:hypothetical protein